MNKLPSMDIQKNKQMNQHNQIHKHKQKDKQKHKQENENKHKISNRTQQYLHQNKKQTNKYNIT